jgi:hypothetical protein
VSTETLSIALTTWLITLCRADAPGTSRSPRRLGRSAPLTKARYAPIAASVSSVRFAPSGAAQSRQRNGDSSDGANRIPSAAASSASISSRSSRIRRNRIHDSSGTYWSAPA